MSGSSDSSPSPEPSYARFTRPQVELILEMFKGATFKKHEYLSMLDHLERLRDGMKEQERLGSRTASPERSQPILRMKRANTGITVTAEMQEAANQCLALQSLVDVTSNLALVLQSLEKSMYAMTEQLSDSMDALTSFSSRMEKRSASGSGGWPLSL